MISFLYCQARSVWASLDQLTFNPFNLFNLGCNIILTSILLTSMLYISQFCENIYRILNHPNYHEQGICYSCSTHELVTCSRQVKFMD